MIYGNTVNLISFTISIQYKYIYKNTSLDHYTKDIDLNENGTTRFLFGINRNSLNLTWDKALCPKHCYFVNSKQAACISNDLVVCLMDMWIELR